MSVITSAAPYLSLLDERDSALKVYALESLDKQVNQLWSEIANRISDIEQLFEDDHFTHRELAALLASKVYYNLGDYDSAVKYSLLAGDTFDTSENSEYVETIVSKCIDSYIKLSQKKYQDNSIVIEPQLTKIFEQMLTKCVQDDVKLALGISLESYRLDIIQQILDTQLKNGASNEVIMNLFGYLLTCCTTVINDVNFKRETLNVLITLLFNFENPDYFLITKIIVQLNEASYAHKQFKKLLNSFDLMAYQIAFDLVAIASQELLSSTLKLIEADESLDQEAINVLRLKKILSGVPTCDLDLTFLSENRNIDISILNTTKKALDGRNSLYHSAVTFANAFMHAGTTDDNFFRSNIEWLGKANHWSKFSATAAFGVIHKGNLTNGRKVLEPYLPGRTSNAHTNGGALFGLGLVYAGQHSHVLSYLLENLQKFSDVSENKDSDTILHGACLGIGATAMGLADMNLYNELNTILYADSALSGQAAALAMGLVMLGTGNEDTLNDMLTYAQETQHETIIRSLAVGIALVCYGQENKADKLIEKMLEHKDAILRYGACFTIGLAYCGTSNEDAIKKLLHVAVSDSNDNVRRASVMCLGFVLLNDYTKVPTIVELLSQSHNPYVRYGAAMALAISCSGHGLKSALDVLEPLSVDAVDFVRQGAIIAKAMILIQQNEKSYPKVTEFRDKLAATVSNKHEESLARFGATLAQGIIDAGGRNTTIQLENTQTNTLNMKAIVGLTLFTQYWYWHPLAHFLSLSFTPTSVIGVTENLKIPKIKINCFARPEYFVYPPKAEVQIEKQAEKVATAVLSTTHRARNRAAKKEKVKESKMDIDEKADSDSEKPKDESVKDSDDKTETHVSLYCKEPYEIENMTRVLPEQMKYITFTKNSRFVPFKKFKTISGIVVLKDTEPEKPFDYIKTTKEKNRKDAPLPRPFKIDPSIDNFDDIED
ncbi:hypothetical protein CANINC_000163 [Pichia inconspicua]|uniref:26S proteasome regulatory subunit RPN2 n=1 Tax=Pichia inconspicua TaxID=52247 RepID=A0A4V4NGA1_9ASCO|nr:hypothetical protein CANINC_000163 [[Candida] inconspicua]